MVADSVDDQTIIIETARNSMEAWYEDNAKKMKKTLQKKRGWKFSGPTSAYSFMQAMGLVSDHAEEGGIRESVEVAK